MNTESSIERYFEHKGLNGWPNGLMVAGWLERDIEDIKVAVMGHCFTAMDYFNHSCTSDCRRGNRCCPNVDGE